MAILTPNQIAAYAYRAGFRGKALNQAVAIAIAESGGNTAAYNPEAAANTKAGSGSRGLWQIYGTAHPWANNSGVFDPQVNANAAFRVFREAGNRFSPWSTFTAGLARVRFDFSKTAFPKNGKAVKSVNTPKAGQPPKATPKRSATTLTRTIPAGSVQTIQPRSAAPESDKGGFIGTGPAAETTGPESIYDYAFLFFGAALILIGIVSLFSFSAGVAGQAILKDTDLKQAAQLLAAA